jgi:hypothetical protein
MGSAISSDMYNLQTIALQHESCFNTPTESLGEDDMPLVTVVLTLAVVGVLLWLVNRFIPMQGTIKGILNAVVVIAVVLWLLKVFDLFSYLTQFRVGH